MPDFEADKTDDSRGQPLSQHDAERMRSEIARLAAAGLPLDQGLESAARELPSGKLSRALHRLANRIHAGESLETALRTEGESIPPHLRGLLAAGMSNGERAADTLHRIVFESRRAASARRRLRVTLAYPGFLVFLMLALVSFFFMYCFAPMMVLLTEFRMSGRIFDDGPLPSQFDQFWATHWGQYVAPAIMIAYVAAVVLAWLFGSQRWMRHILHRVPGVGVVLRWSAVEQLASILAQLIEAKTPLPVALQLSADSLDDARVARDCSRMAVKAGEGMSLTAALGHARSVPRDVAPLVAWGEKSGALPEALRSVAEIFGAKARLRVDVIAILAPAFAFGFIALGVIVLVLWQIFVVTYFLDAMLW